MTVCAQQEFASADAEMNKVYKQVMAKVSAYSQDKDVSRRYEEALKTSQNAWLQFRDADCAFSNFDREGGSSQAMNIYDCKADLTKARTRALLEALKS